MRKTASLFLSGLAFLALATFGCNGYDQETHAATLTGANEVPAVTTTGSGTFSIVFDGPAAKYTLNVSNLTGITRSHIHAGTTGNNGSVMVFLYDGPTITTAYTGKLGVGSFTADMITACASNTDGLTCQATGGTPPRTFAGIQDASATGGVYVNVHTTTNAGGEIRGQIQ